MTLSVRPAVVAVVLVLLVSGLAVESSSFRSLGPVGGRPSGSVGSPSKDIPGRRRMETNLEKSTGREDPAPSITRKYRNLFRIGAAFNVAVSAILMLPRFFFPLLRIAPVPGPSIYLHMSSGSIGCFGLGYYWASKDLPRHSDLVRLGVLGKIGVNVLALVHCLFLETVGWQVFLLCGWDVVFAALFARALLDLSEEQKEKTL